MIDVWKCPSALILKLTSRIKTISSKSVHLRILLNFNFHFPVSLSLNRSKHSTGLLGSRPEQREVAQLQKRYISRKKKSAYPSVVNFGL